MGKEIERKFLIVSDDYKEKASEVHGQKLRQGYFADGVRVRTSIDGFEVEKGFITFKTPKRGMTRTEFEYEIPYSEAEEILNDLCKGPIIEKFRHIVYYKENKWEVDEFFGDNEGLVVAELEMDSEEHEFEKPSWLGEDVTHKKKYYNSDLTENPYKNWDKLIELQFQLLSIGKEKQKAVENKDFDEAANLRDKELDIKKRMEKFK